MAETCPECKATLDDPSKPCEWCGHAPAFADAAAGVAEDANTAPPPAGYAAHAKPDPAPSIPRPARVPTPVASAPAASPPPTASAPDSVRMVRAFSAPTTTARAPAPKPAAGPAPLPTPMPAPMPQAAAAVEASPTSLRGSREQILDGVDLSAGPLLELDMAAGSLPLQAAGNGSASMRVASAPAPLARGRDIETPDLDPIEIRMIGRFGAVPESWWATPGYVRHVRARRVELENELPIAEQQYLASKSALDDALLSIGQRAIAEVRNTSKARGSYLKTLDRLAKREAELKGVDASAFEESEKHRETMLGLFTRIEETKKKLLGGKSKELVAGLAALEQERDAAERAMKTPGTSLAPEVDRVRKEFRATCADFAQLVLDDRTNFAEDYEEPRARVARLRNASDAAQKKLLLHRAAMTAYDAAAFATGQRVTYAAIVFAILSFVVLVFVLK